MADRFGDQGRPIQHNGIDIAANCWNASIEYLMSLHGLSSEVYVYMPDMYRVATYFQNQSKVINESEVKAGDVLIVTNVGDSKILQHTAVVIGPNLVFEKTAPQDNAPFRISYLSDIKAKFDRLVTTGVIPNKVQFTYHEFKKENVKGIDTESLGLLYFEPISEGLAAELIRIHPQVEPKKLLQTCFPGLGGGCDPFISQLEIVDLVVSLSGTFQLSGEQKTFCKPARVSTASTLYMKLAFFVIKKEVMAVELRRAQEVA